MALVNALAGTRNELHLAYAQLNLAAAWLAMDDSRKHSAWHGPGGLWVYASSCSDIGLII